MFSVLGAILAIGVLIVVHEAGHFIVARRCKMRVDRFSIGFGPSILKWRRGETDFTLGPIPFGGFVQIHGMTLADEVAPDDTRSYPNRPAWQRFATIFAGPATNYVFAIVLGIALFTVGGVHSGTAWYAVDKVTDGFDAKGKLEPGDRILRLEDRPIYVSYRGKEQAKLSELVNASRGRPLKLTVLRDGREVQVSIVPKLAKNEHNQDAYRLGIELAVDEERAHVGLARSIGEAFYYPIDKTKIIAVSLYEIATGQQKPEFRSVIGITDLIKQALEAGWIRLLELLMLLNVYLGLFNLLPLPALDGGRLVFLGYEMVTRRRANPKVEATVHMVGIMALLLLMVLVTYQDIARLFS